MRVNPFLHDPPKQINVRVRVSNVTIKELAEWAERNRYDCTITPHFGVWYDAEKNETLHEKGLTLETAIDSQEHQRCRFESVLRGFLKAHGEQFAWVEYNGEGRLV